MGDKHERRERRQRERMQKRREASEELARQTQKRWPWYVGSASRVRSLITVGPKDEKVMRSNAKDGGLRLENSDKQLHKRVLKFISERVTYSIDFSGDALTPVQTLVAKRGVCLEYANLACALINIALPHKCLVVVGINSRQG